MYWGSGTAVGKIIYGNSGLDFPFNVRGPARGSPKRIVDKMVHVGTANEAVRGYH